MNLVSLIAATSLVSNLTTIILNFIPKIVYFITKWFLLAVDIIFSYIQRLAGLDIDYSSASSLISKESDIVFNLLLSNSESVISIIKALIGLALILIIIFTIIMIIKSQYEALKTGNGEPLFAILRKALKSFFLLIITPLIAIVGIVASDIILVALYNATNTTGSMSVGTQIFVTSTTSANAYRIYASNGLRIPIVIDFEKDAEILNYYSSEANISDEFLTYLTDSENNVIYATYKMFSDGTYYEFSNLTATEANEATRSLYYTYYDSSGTNDGTDSLAQYKRIEAYATEYFVMADVIDYCVKTGQTLYIKSIQDVLDDALSVSDDIFNSIVTQFGIEFYDDNGEEIEVTSDKSAKQIYESSSWSLIHYYSNYYAVDESNEPSTRQQIVYNHVRDAIDEYYGAKFIIAYEVQTTIDEVTYSYYYPLTVGYSASGSSYTFTSEYIQRGQIISAKGIFKDGTYPTAIKKTNANSSNIEFYRCDIEDIAVGETKNYFTIEFTYDNTSFFGKLSTIFKAIFSPEDLIGDVSVDLNAVAFTYTANINTINYLTDGGIALGYFMRYSTGSADVNLFSEYSLTILDVYLPSNMNFIVLLFASILLMKAALNAIFSLIQRSFELFLIILIYPVACSTVPLDDGRGNYASWLKSYTQKLFSTYGFILGINFILMLFPVIEQIEFFTAEEIATTTIIRRIGNVLFLLGFTPNQLATLLNLLVTLFFEIVAFTMLETAPQMISSFTGGEELDTNKAAGEVFGNIKKSTLSVVKGVLTLTVPITKVATFAVSAAKDPKALAKKLIPGSAVVEEAKRKKYIKDKKKERDEAEDELMESLKSSSTTREEIEEKLKKYKESNESYTRAINDPKKEAMNDAKKRANAENGTKENQSSRKDDDESSEKDKEDEDIWKAEPKESNNESESVGDDKSSKNSTNESRRQQIKNNRQQAKIDKKRKEDIKLFRVGGSYRKKGKVLKNIDKQNEKLVEQLQNSGIQDAEELLNMNKDEIKEYVKNNKGNLDQKHLDTIRQIYDNVGYQDQLIEINSTEVENISKDKEKKRERADREMEGKLYIFNPVKRVKKFARNASAKRNANNEGRIKKIESKNEGLNKNKRNYYTKMLKNQQKISNLQSQQKTAQDYIERNHRAYKSENKAILKGEKEFEKFRRKAQQQLEGQKLAGYIKDYTLNDVDKLAEELKRQKKH